MEPLASENGLDCGVIGRIEDALATEERRALHAWADRNRIRRDDPAWAIAELFLVLSEAAASRLRTSAEGYAVVQGEIARTLEEADVRLSEITAAVEEAGARAARQEAGAVRAAEALRRPLERALRTLEPASAVRRYRWWTAHALLLIAFGAAAFFAGNHYRAGRAYEALPVQIRAERASAVAGEVFTRHLYWALDDRGRSDLRAFVAGASADSVRLLERGDRLTIARGAHRVEVSR